MSIFADIKFNIQLEKISFCNYRLTVDDKKMKLTFPQLLQLRNKVNELTTEDKLESLINNENFVEMVLSDDAEADAYSTYSQSYTSAGSRRGSYTYLPPPIPKSQSQGDGRRASKNAHGGVTSGNAGYNLSRSGSYTQHGQRRSDGGLGG